MNLTKANYHSLQANTEYWSVSQFKSFMDCQAKAVAEIYGKYTQPKTDALLMGSYVDAWFQGSTALDTLLDNHPEMFNKRTGELKAQYQKADRAIRRAEQDPVFMSYLSGLPQVLMTGELFGEDWKVLIDFLHDDKIVDLKFMKDMKPVYKGGEWKPFIDAWGYDIQGYIYQQIVKQNTGKELPFYLAVITKEEVPDIELIHIPQWRLNGVASLVEHYIEEFSPIKRGIAAPERCGVCDYCKQTKRIVKPIEYEELLDE